jgi:hypothetical protein
MDLSSALLEFSQRSRAGMNPAECLDTFLDLHAKKNPPSIKQAEAIALAQAAFPWARLYAIQLFSFTKKGESQDIQLIFHSFVADLVLL